MGFVKKITDAVGITQEIDTSAQEQAAREQAEATRKAADQQAKQARWQAEASANQQATLQQREQLQQQAQESSPVEDLNESADIQVGDSGAEARRRRQQFSSSGTNSDSPSIRI